MIQPESVARSVQWVTEYYIFVLTEYTYRFVYANAHLHIV